MNKKAYESLPKDIQMILDTAIMENEHWCLAQFDAQNGAALQELIFKHKVELVKFPDDVLKGLAKLADEVVEEEAAKDPQSKKVNEAFKAFQKIVGTWGAVSEKVYYDIIQKDFPLKG